MTRTFRRPGALLAAIALVVTTLVMLEAGGPGVAAATGAKARSTELGCPTGDVPEDGFNDVADGWPHEASIDCVLWWGVAQGTSDPTYSPDTSVTRGQLATLMVRLIERTGGSIPDATSDHFDDDDGSVHEDNINRLAEAGVVRGTGDRTYEPNRGMTRGQLATVLVGTYELRTGATLPEGGDHFSDDNGSVHEESINRVAEAGIAEGRSDGTFGPNGTARRDQMASFLARSLDLFVEGGYATAPEAGTSTVFAVGDIASCNYDRDEQTAALVAPRAGTVLILGDAVYETGTLEEYQSCYGPGWGQFKLRTRPESGNHDYITPGASGYYDYWGAQAGERDKGWYSFDLGRWHVIGLNSECAQVGCEPGSEQEAWLRADLAAHPAVCTAAFFHRPRFSSGLHGNEPTMAPLFQALYDGGADLVLASHEHSYERMAPVDPSEAVDEAAGVRGFVVGTGGRDLYELQEPHAATEARDNTSFGVLKLELAPDSYSWEFLNTPSTSFTDSGSDTCR